MERRRITQRDVAREVGVDRSTVSLAYRGHPSIPADTRKRVLTACKKLGYAIDPMLAALAAYRTRVRPAKYHGTLAWLAQADEGFDWRSHLYFADYFRGAVARARELGYEVKVFEIRAGLTPQRVASVLAAQNVRGVLVCPQPHPAMTLGFPWQDFSAVTFGYTLKSPRLHTVTAAHYQAMLHTMRSLRKLGYKRIGLFLHEEHDRRTEHSYMSGYLMAEKLDAPKDPLPALTAGYDDTAALKNWVSACEPDVVVSCSYRIPTLLASTGLAKRRLPDMACPALPNASFGLAGVVESSVEIGSVAVNFLVGMIQRGEQGSPPSPYRIHVEGHWLMGKTLRKYGTHSGAHAARPSLVSGGTA
jgi:LacI family transcriptional regulator/LacI family repressor for deo operon, udp, cdd, tsx, nupC, and nupG